MNKKRKILVIEAGLVLVLLIGVSVSGSSVPGGTTQQKSFTTVPSNYQQYITFFEQHQTQLDALEQYVHNYIAVNGNIEGFYLTPAMQSVFNDLFDALQDLYAQVGLPSDGTYMYVDVESQPLKILGQEGETPPPPFYGRNGVWHTVDTFEYHGEEVMGRLIALNNLRTIALRWMSVNFGFPAAVIFLAVLIAAHIEPQDAAFLIILVWEAWELIRDHLPTINKGHGIKILSYWSYDVFNLEYLSITPQPGYYWVLPNFWAPGWG